MQKYQLSWTVFLLLGFICVCALSCSKDDNGTKTPETANTSFNDASLSIIGTWLHEEKDGSYTFIETLIIKADGSFLIRWQENSSKGEESGSWSYDTNDHIFTMNTLIGEKPGTQSIKVEFHDNVLTFIEKDGDTMSYIKQ